MLRPAGRNRPPGQGTPTPTPTPKAEPTRLVVGVGDLPPGFNPHLLADRSPVTTALATLVLPSPFKVAADGTLQLDPTIVSSARVVDSNPFTVSYELNLEASWSDNAPVAAEDFVYLWQQMRTQPGAADAAGYQLITDVRSRAGGKAVDVVFSQPYPAWQQLFSGLLPAHLLKDAPGSWIGATTGGLPTSGRPVQGLLRRPRPRRDRAHPQRRLLGHPDRARPAGAAQARPVEPRRGPHHRRRRRGAPAGRPGRAHRARRRHAPAPRAGRARSRASPSWRCAPTPAPSRRPRTPSAREAHRPQRAAHRRRPRRACPPTRSAWPPRSPATRRRRRRALRPIRPVPRSCSPQVGWKRDVVTGRWDTADGGPRGSSSAPPPIALTTCGWPGRGHPAPRRGDGGPGRRAARHRPVRPADGRAHAAEHGPVRHARRPPRRRRPPRPGWRRTSSSARGPSAATSAPSWPAPTAARPRPRSTRTRRGRPPASASRAAAAVQRADVARAARGQRGRRRAHPLAAGARAAALPARHASS